ncbi:Phosphoribosylformylglycinamidine (FGAM) synthase [Commensalibacter communis]|uniref:Phosphoribosylformylglycinamidine synthase subunit PurS n=1 Tax=Commensalibacter communis TaxID=2972786 RepID=A0A9W4TNF9_9PROT|nr:phosphoribosylformylglycinamidine synthase subunit PurS [Commensalibacter communis]CAI3923087.1 Phosphoribosylformylglycinamidine (FGAM) synthase [Commensalibacter communis]CAI3927074.1 Phosphoribosylformylglycinamidine (FGAM) synthase [Commensalibacter communis]CAI3927668.1 Phosphoribosylformylglycinamidine (FGAM) synthase [Commensalibacter communis]CAI3933789.1 Phosphoribosylformylglycinamidine (FGAM) synthase [Commensalibacter communis]CAI3935090.1 Phosphoribosylformylglycinamidine (FGAM
MKVRLIIMLKQGVLDPQGKAINHALHNLSFQEVQDVRVGRVIDLEVTETSPEKAKARATEMAQQLLANGVIEDFQVEVLA